MRSACIGVDLGTSSLAAVVTDDDGRVIFTFTAPNPCAAAVASGGRDEQDADEIALAADAIVSRCEEFARSNGLSVAKVGWTGQMHGVVAVDRDLKALTPFVTWRDARCAPPALAVGVMEDWRRHDACGIHRVLTLPGFVIARRTGRVTIDPTFYASLGRDASLECFKDWLPEIDADAPMLGDNQAGVYAALKVKPDAAVVNLGTSGQLSVVTDRKPDVGNQEVEVRPFPGGRTLVCRASHVGGVALAKLRESLGWSWDRLNAEAEHDPRVRRCVDDVVGDLAKGMVLDGVQAIVGVGNALRLNPCILRAVERRFKLPCLVPEVEEMAAWGAALYARCLQNQNRLEDTGGVRMVE